MSKFQAIKELIENVAPKIAKEGAEEAAAKYIVPGKWQTDQYNVKGYVEELPIDFLQKYKGNTLGKTDIQSLKKSIEEEGLNEPLILSFDPKTNKIKLGEGNHRLEALRQLGYTHAPVRAYRSSIRDDLEDILGPQYSQYPKVPFKPSKDPIDPYVYYPADSKPSDIIDFDKLNAEKQKSTKNILGLGAVGLGASALLPDEAKAEQNPKKETLQKIIGSITPEQKDWSFKDQLDLQEDKLKQAGNVLIEPAEYDELDTSGYLPNQQMAGQGLQKILRSALELQPREEELPVIGKDPITGKEIRLDPTAIATTGSLKLPKQEFQKILEMIKNK